MQKVHKAVIAAGGWSTRFLPTVKAYAKHLVPILNKPQIHYLLDELAYCGITEVCIVHRPGELTIKHYLKPDKTLNNYLQKTGKTSVLNDLEQTQKKIKFTFIPQTSRFPYGNGSPILCAKHLIGKDPFIYMFGDDLVIENTPGQYLNSLIHTFTEHKAQALVGCQSVPKNQVNSYGIIEFHQNSPIKNQIKSIVEKPTVEKSPSTNAVFGRFVFSSKIIDVLQKTAIARGELWLADAVNNLSQTDLVIAPSTKDAFWITTGDPLNWLKANLLFALQNPSFRPEILSLIASPPV